MLKKAQRISNQRLILKLSKQGKAYRTKWFVFKFLPAIALDSQFALSISKKVAAKATVRNKLKRQVYDSLRRRFTSIPKPIVCLIFVKKEIPERRDYAEIDTQIGQFINHLHSNV